MSKLIHIDAIRVNESGDVIQESRIKTVWASDSLEAASLFATELGKGAYAEFLGDDGDDWSQVYSGERVFRIQGVEETSA